MRQEVISWDEIENLIDHMLPQFDHEFETMVLITRGGVIPGGLLAEALHISTILTAAVDFPAEFDLESQPKEKSRWLAWPKFLQFPADNLLADRKILIVDDVWGSGRTINAVKNRIAAADATPYTCVLHFNPYRNAFDACKPDYYGATTDAYIIYPWEIDRGRDGILLNRHDLK